MSRYLAFAFVVGLVAIIGVSTTRAGQPSNVQATFIEGGFRYTCAGVNGGALECWGNNNLGQLGDGTEMQRTSPVITDEYTGRATDLALSDIHTCALDDGGGVMCWGSNDFGVLGDGGTQDSKTPVQVEDLESGVSQIASGELHTCAVLDDGPVKCWGANYAAQLGDGTYDDRHEPVNVVNMENAVQVDGGEDDFSCVATETGAAMCWGANYEGQLGDGTNVEESPHPTQVVGLTSGVVDVVGGGDFACALMADHEVYCWGENNFGQLGDGSNDSTNTPVKVENLDDATALSAGAFHTCAITEDMHVKCWGQGGLVGNGSDDPEDTPKQVSNLTEVTSIAGGYDHTCAIRKDGSVWCWGFNGNGQLGDGTTEPRLVPVQAELVEPPATPTPPPTATPNGGELAWGDDDCDADVDSVDSLKNLRFVAALSVSQEKGCPEFGAEVAISDLGPRQWGDVDCDKDVDSVDALKILRHVAALPVIQPKGCPEIGAGVGIEARH